MKTTLLFSLLATFAFAAPPRVVPPSPTSVVPCVISAAPTEDELRNCAAFREALIPTATTTAGDRAALAAALNAFLTRTNADDFSALENYLTANPASPWAASVRLNLGHIAFTRGWFSKALSAWQATWDSTKNDISAKRIADLAGAEVAMMLARVGRQEDLETALGALALRGVQASAAAKVASAGEGAAAMHGHPEVSFRCGPYALMNCAISAGTSTGATWVDTVHSPAQGFSLAELATMAPNAGLAGWQMARRSPGAAVVTPCVVHWNLDHFAALLPGDAGEYVMKDPTFGSEHRVTAAALDAEASGYCLIPGGALLPGWVAVDAAEGGTIFGKGHTGSSDTGETDDCAKKKGGKDGECGMATYSFHELLAGLTISDTPAWYDAPWGPPLLFEVNYNQKEVDQPAVMNFTNFGPLWECRWVSYLEDDPALTTSPLIFHYGGGGTETVTTYGVGTLFRYDQTEVVKVAAGNYERRIPDGSKEVYARAIGTTGPNRKVFLSRIVDAQGNAVTLEYDNTPGFETRLKKIIAADGAFMELFYNEAGSPYLVSKVRDPFLREAIFTYATVASAKRLTSITDPISIVSSVGYDTAGFVNSLTTPYGTTRFAYGQSNTAHHGLIRWVEATDPYGDKERLEFYLDELTTYPAIDVPTAAGFSTLTSSIFPRHTYFWDKKAWNEAPGDRTKAHATEWLTVDAADKAVGVPESVKLPFQNRVFFNYPGQTSGVNNLGSMTLPSATARVVENAAGTRTTEITRREYNTKANVTKIIDPAGRETRIEYAAGDLDVRFVRQKNGAALDVISEVQYNVAYPAHLPWKVTDAAGQATTFTWNANGQILTITNALNETVTYAYETNSAANGYGRPLTITGPVVGATMTFTYDAFDRVLTSTDSAGHTLTFLYDNLDRPTRVTFPDATYEETTYTAMDATKLRDRLGRISQTKFNALRQPVFTEDALGRITQLEWCRCGDLKKLFDGEGNETFWKHDVAGRVYEKRYADGRTEAMTFQPLSGRLATITDAKLQSKTVRYNVDGTVNGVDYTAAVNPAANVSFTYDPVYPRLATMTDGIGTTAHTYHPPGALGALRVATVDGPLAGTSDTARYTYDALGRTKTRNIGTGTTENLVTWNFDTLGRLDDTLSPLGAVDYLYVAQTERLDQVNLPNGARTQFGYFGASGDHRLQQIKYLAVAANPASIVSQHDYTYDTEGQIATWGRVLGAATSTFTLGYDNAGQLASATSSGAGGTIDRHAYTYDKAGNRRTAQRNLALNQWGANNRNQLTNQSGGGKLRVAGHLSEPAKVTINGTKATVNAANEYEAFVDVVPGANTLAVTATDYAPTPNVRTTSWSVIVTSGTPVTFAYDLNGNMTSDGTRTFAWDSENRLKSVTIGASVWSWDYDGMNRRVRERLNGILQRQWVWCGAERCEERDAANSVARRFYPEGEMQGGTALFYTRDHLGSIRELLDNTATVRARYDYTPYGERTKLAGDLDTDRAFTGHELHSATGLHLAPYRAYDAVLGRWISPDPIGEAGGVNLYAYCSGDPVGCIDPLGLWDAPGLQDYSNFFAGYADSFTFGITEKAREGLMGMLGMEGDGVDHCSSAYKNGERTQIAQDLATLGASAGLKLALKAKGKNAARKQANKAISGMTKTQHHKNTVIGHPGTPGIGSHFPTGGLPTSVHSGSWNLMTVAEGPSRGVMSAQHLALHGRARLFENIALGSALLGPLGQGMNAYREGCD